MTPARRALVAIVDSHIHGRVERLLDIAAVESERALDRDAALALASRQAFDLVISDLPLGGDGRRQFIARVAGCGAPSAGSPVVLYGDFRGPSQLEGVGEVSQCRSLIELLRATAWHLRLGNRVAHRLLVQMDIEVEEARIRRAIQTANLSPSGMLLRTQRPLPVGSVVPFSLDLPSGIEPIAGRVEVVRHADPVVEGLFGMGVRFVELATAADQRLSSFVSSVDAPARRPRG